MDKDLRKRLEEAAEKYADNHGFRVPYDGSNNFYDDIDVKVSKEGFIAGAEHGYKEAIAQAKEWMEKYFPDELDGKNFEFVSRDEVIADFEIDMNKL